MFLYLLIFHCVKAVSIPIADGDFESQPGYRLQNNTFFYVDNGPNDQSLAHWPLWDPHSRTHYWSAGILNPTGGTSYNDPVFGTSCPVHYQCLYLEAKHFGGGEFGVEQLLTSYTLQTDTTYILSAYIGDPMYNEYSSYSTDSQITRQVEGFPGYKLQLVTKSSSGVDTIILEDDNTATPGEGRWILASAQATITSTHPNSGEPLYVRLINKNAANSGKKMNMDDIQLTAQPTAELTLQPTRGTASKQPSSSPSRDPAHSLTFHPTSVPNTGNSVTRDPSKGPTFGTPAVTTLYPTLNPSVSTISHLSTENIASTEMDSVSDQSASSIQEFIANNTLMIGLSSALLVAIIVIICLMKRRLHQRQYTASIQNMAENKQRAGTNRDQDKARHLAQLAAESAQKVNSGEKAIMDQANRTQGEADDRDVFNVQMIKQGSIMMTQGHESDNDEVNQEEGGDIESDLWEDKKKTDGGTNM
eukprot:76417_1